MIIGTKVIEKTNDLFNKLKESLKTENKIENFLSELENKKDKKEYENKIIKVIKKMEFIQQFDYEKLMKINYIDQELINYLMELKNLNIEPEVKNKMLNKLLKNLDSILNKYQNKDSEIVEYNNNINVKKIQKVIEQFKNEFLVQKQKLNNQINYSTYSY